MAAAGTRGGVTRTAGQRVDSGDRIVSHIPGGGGYGDPLERDPEAVAADVRDELLTREAAIADYGVILAPDGAVDIEATAAERAGRGEDHHA